MQTEHNHLYNHDYNHDGHDDHFDVQLELDVHNDDHVYLDKLYDHNVLKLVQLYFVLVDGVDQLVN